MICVTFNYDISMRILNNIKSSFSTSIVRQLVLEIELAVYYLVYFISNKTKNTNIIFKKSVDY